MSGERKRIVLSQIITDLENGVTRLKSDSAYNAERGSIEEKYELSATAVKEIFKHPLLANKRVRVPKEPEFILVDDITPTNETQETSNTSESPVSQEAPETPESPVAVEETANDVGSMEDPIF